MENNNVGFGGAVNVVVRGKNLEATVLMRGRKVLFSVSAKLAADMANTTAIYGEEPWRGFIPKEKRVRDPREASLRLAWTIDKKVKIQERATHSLTTHLLAPSVSTWTEMWQGGTFNVAFPHWTNYVRKNRQLVEEAFSIARQWGVLNGEIIMRETECQVLLAIAMLEFSGLDRISLLRSWHSEEAFEKYGLSWLFVPYPWGHMTPFGKLSREQRGAMGWVKFSAGNVDFQKVNNAEMGYWCQVAQQDGLGAYPHAQGKYANLAPMTDDGKMFFAVDGGKWYKTLNRWQLLKANTARLEEAEESFLRINGMPANVGRKTKVLFTDNVPCAYDGGALLKRGLTFTVYEQGTMRMQVPAEVKVLTTEGDIVSEGKSLIGVDGYAPTPAEVTILEVSERQVNAENANHVYVRYEEKIVSRAPKVKNIGYKVSTHTDMTGVMDNIEAEVWLTAKNKAALVSLWANTTENVVNMDYPLEGDVIAAFHEWVAANTVTVKTTWEVVGTVANVMAQKGVEVEKRGNKWFATQSFTGVYGYDILEVESPVTEKRDVRVALSPTIAVEAAKLVKTGFEPVKTRTYGVPKKLLSFGDAASVSAMPYDEMLAELHRQYPEGALLSNRADAVNNMLEGATVTPAYVGVDFTAIRRFSAGAISPDNPMGLAIVEVIQTMGNLKLVVDEVQNSTGNAQQLIDAAEELGRAINWLRSSIASLALSSGVLKRLTRGRRTGTLLTGRAYDFVPVEEVWVNPQTAAKFQLRDKDKVLAGRFPTPLFMGLTLRVREDVPATVAVFNGLTVQAGTKGDVDGDQYWLMRLQAVADNYRANRRDRDLAARLISMVAWNSAPEFQAELGDNFKMTPKDKYLTVDFKDVWESRVADYCRWEAMGNSNYAGEFENKDFAAKFIWQENDGVVSMPRLGEYVEFNAAGPGVGYGAAHNAWVLANYVSHAQAKAVFEIAEAILWSLSEDVFLAGATDEHVLIYEVLSKTITTREVSSAIAKLKKAMSSNGMPLVETRGISADLIAKAIIVCANMFRAMRMNQEEIEARQIELSNFANYAPICKIWRGLTSGDPTLIGNQEEWTHLVSETPVDNPLSEIAGSIAPVYRLLAAVVDTRASQTEEEL